MNASAAALAAGVPVSPALTQPLHGQGVVLRLPPTNATWDALPFLTLICNDSSARVLATGALMQTRR